MNSKAMLQVIETNLESSTKRVSVKPTGTTTLGQRSPGNNGNEGVLYSPQIFRTGISQSYA